MKLEYGIAWYTTPDTLHIGPMTREEAIQWVVEWEEDCGGPLGTFLVVSRFVEPWEAHTDRRQFDYA